MAMAAALLLAPAPARPAESAAGAWDLKRLMHSLAQVKEAKARFTERREIAFLSTPLESSGTLIYTAPGRLQKHTLEPRRESLLLEGDRLTLENRERDQRRTFALPEYPVIWALVESIRSTLAGDYATLTRFYQASLEGSEAQWRLILKPVEPAMRGVVREIGIEGRRDEVIGVEIFETSGDRTVMTITREP